MTGSKRRSPIYFKCVCETLARIYEIRKRDGIQSPKKNKNRLYKSFIYIYLTYKLIIRFMVNLKNLKTILWCPSGGMGHC